MGSGVEEAMKLLMDTLYEDLMEIKPIKLIISSKQKSDEGAMPGDSGEGQTGVSGKRAVQKG